MNEADLHALNEKVDEVLYVALMVTDLEVVRDDLQQLNALK